MPIGGQLNPVRQPTLEVGQEVHRFHLSAPADQPRRDQLGVGVNGGPRPHVAVAVRPLLVRRDVLGLGMDEGPNLVALDPSRGQVAERSVLIGRDDFPQVDQQPGNRVPPKASQARGRADGVSFDQARDDLRSFCGGQLVHMDTMRKSRDNSLSRCVRGFEIGSERRGLGRAVPLPSGLGSPARTLTALFGGHVGRPLLATNNASEATTRNRSRVLLSDRLRGSLTSRKVHDGLGTLVGIAGHLGSLHSPERIAVHA